MGFLADIGFGDFEESLAKGDLIGIGTGGLSRGLGRQLEPVVKGITGETQAEAAREAAEAQTTAAEKGIAEQRRQFDVTTELLSDYVGAGELALQEQMNLAGIGDPEAQAQAIEQIKQSPMYQSLISSGEEAILSKQLATGRGRAGSTKAALAQYRPQVLGDLINQQYSRLGGLTTLGQQSAAITGSAGQTMASNVGNLFGQIGAAQAGQALAEGEAALTPLRIGGQIIGGGIGAFLGGPAGAAAGVQAGGNIL